MIRPIRLIAVALSALCVSPFSFAADAPAAHVAATSTNKPAKPKAHKAPPPRDAQVDRWINVGGFGEVAIYKPKDAA
ncbi:MAG TPA: hypothetical protein VGC55_03830, partial [Dokdonella sp.]